MEAWLEAIARMTGAGVLALDSACRPLTAEPCAMRLLGCASSAELGDRLRPVMSQLELWCGAAARNADAGGVLRTAGTESVRARVFGLGEVSSDPTRYVVLLDAETSRSEPTPLSAFARQLGHDLRGPLNAMVLNLDLMRISVESSDDDAQSLAKRRRYLGNIQREIHRLSELLTAALDRAKTGTL